MLTDSSEQEVGGAFQNGFLSVSIIDQISLYRRAAFRRRKPKFNYFSLEKGYPDGLEKNGVPLRDMIWFERTN